MRSGIAVSCQGGNTLQIGVILMKAKQKYSWLICPNGGMRKAIIRL